jgi:hypothetical protein
LSLSQDLLFHAIGLLPNTKELHPGDVSLRRAVSAAYYALFHEINGDAVAIIAPNVPSDINHRIQRWFDHGEMKKICGRFTAAKLDQPLLGLIGPSASSDLQTVARSFIELQEARHRADYDLGYSFTWDEARHCIELAIRANKAWIRIQSSAEANIFILSLLLWKNWDKDR